MRKSRKPKRLPKKRRTIDQRCAALRRAHIAAQAHYMRRPGAAGRSLGAEGKTKHPTHRMRVYHAEHGQSLSQTVKGMPQNHARQGRGREFRAGLAADGKNARAGFLRADREAARVEPSRPPLALLGTVSPKKCTASAPLPIFENICPQSIALFIGRRNWGEHGEAT
jgi:hypothetical protein